MLSLYVATKPFSLADRRILKGDLLAFDAAPGSGAACHFKGETFAAPFLRGALKLGWIVLDMELAQ